MDYTGAWKNVQGSKMITNRTRNKVISREILLCNKLWSSMKGLMFRKELQENQCLLIDLHKDTNASIHMFFVNFPIDIIWLNSEKRVVDFARNVQPNTPYKAPSKFARYILELPEKTLDKNPVSIGDLFEFNTSEQ